MVKINGKEYEVRSLTMPEVRRVRKLEDDEADILSIHLCTGIGTQEAADWFNRVPMGVSSPVLVAIAEASLLSEDAQFPDAPGDDVGVERDAE